MRNPVRRPFILDAVLLAFTLLSGPAPAQALAERARAQIAALLAEKDARTPAQRKIDSNLLYTVRMNRGEAIADGVARLDTGLDPASDVPPVVDIVAQVSDGFFAKIRALGGEVLDAQPAFRNVRATLPLQSVEVLAAEPEVGFVQPKQEARTWRVVPLPAGRPKAAAAAVSADLRGKLASGFEERAERLRAHVVSALVTRDAADGGRAVNKVNTSEGDVTHRAALARSTFGVTGAGVKIGVLSDGVTSLAARQATGDLPGVTVLPGQAGSGDEGTAMLEIVHDLAPGAQLYFATAFTSLASFAQNILDLRTAGCDVIVDDVFYFVESPFQKGQAPGVVSTTNGGLVIQSYATVTAAGALAFSSAGNSGNLTSSTSGTWEGDFADGGAVAAPIIGAGNFHDFGGQDFNVVAANGSGATLHWSDPLGASANDYDLFLVDAPGGSVLASSTNVQSGTQDPYEVMGTTASARIVIVKRTGAAARFLHLDTLRGQLSIPTTGSTHGHSSPPGLYAFGVAATPASTAIGGVPNPIGPYPGPFNSSNMIELFSSDGPRRYFFNADSSPITPGNFSSTGGDLQNKPDLTAADGVSTATPGFSPFFGTSAAAPHAAAIAALVKSAAPFASQAQLRTYLLTGAIDVMAAGTDRNSGVGILDAYAVVEVTGVSPASGLVIGTFTAAEATGNANALIEPGECGTLGVQLQNVSSLITARAVSASLTTATPGVTITQGTVPFPDIAPGGSATSATPFRFSLATSAGCPLVVNFTLAVTYTGGRSPQAFSIPLRTGKPPLSFSSTLDAVAPAVPTGFSSATTGAQAARLFRDGVAGSCGTTKPGGTTSTGTRLYDAYTFTNCSSSTACMSVTLDHPGFGGGGTATPQLYVAAYAGSFNPANILQNFTTDAGASATSRSFSFSAAPGQAYVIVVSEVNSGAAASYPYTLTVDGSCFPCTAYSPFACCPSGALTMSAPPAVASGSPNRTASVPSTPGATYNWGITNGTITGGQGTSRLTFTAGTSGTVALTVQETGPTGCLRSANANVPILAGGSAVLLYTVPPCRLLDTRDPAGTFGAPALQPGQTRTFPLASRCGIPSGARAVSANVTITGATQPGYLTLFPGDGTQPLASSINFAAGQTRASNVVLPVSSDGTAAVKAFTGSVGPVDLILDVNGYFR